MTAIPKDFKDYDAHPDNAATLAPAGLQRGLLTITEHNDDLKGSLTKSDWFTASTFKGKPQGNETGQDNSGE
ncbi:hypothetical protein N7478_013170 [Penicillium angulare]|uniref:uncharacterized protein n=1 Tax=Penicillium angulare TaxID=116970 RepID=UPI00254197DF|nr:uncharacterized protein N7478_013170 [Penicillium angulare]KAJ5257066.1 hypothetical protein N7478_013170 [Penicillium angulare]